MLRVAATDAPRVGARLTMHPSCDRLTGGAERSGFDPDSAGRWEVVMCEPISGSASRVNVYIRAH